MQVESRVCVWLEPLGAGKGPKTPQTTLLWMSDRGKNRQIKTERKETYKDTYSHENEMKIMSPFTHFYHAKHLYPILKLLRMKSYISNPCEIL